jgi:hypothetical protein
VYLYLASFATRTCSNSSCLMVAPSLSHSVAGPSQGILQPFGTVLNLMTLQRRKALDLSFVPCARYARSYLTCYFKVIFRAWMHTETAALARVRSDNTAPSKKYLRLIKNLDRRQASLLFQLHSGHVALNHHLFRIRRSETPSCPHCQGITVETVKHFLLDCPQYVRERHKLRIKLRRNASSLSFLLSSPEAVLPLLKFVHATGRFKTFFGKDIDERIHTNSRKNAELRAAAEALETSIRNNSRNTHHT